DELAGHFERFGRTILVVVGDEVDLPPVDPAVVVDLLEVGADDLADGAVRRERPTVRIRVADLDLGGGNARLGQSEARHERGRQERQASNEAERGAHRWASWAVRRASPRRGCGGWAIRSSAAARRPRRS